MTWGLVSSRRALAVAFGSAILAAGPTGGVQASTPALQEMGEWVVACDNLATCSAVNASRLTQLRVSQPSPFGMSRVCIHRQSGPQDAAQVFLTMRGPRPKAGAAEPEERLLRIVGGKTERPDIAMRYRGADHWEVPWPAASLLLADLGKGTELHVVARDGSTIERVSVRGIDQALAAFDRQQARAGTVSALRERGEKPASAQPVRPRPPRLVTASLPRLSPLPAPSADTQRLRQQVCGRPGPEAPQAYRLLGDQQRPDRTLWAMPCDSQEGLRRSLFLIENRDGKAEPVAFPAEAPERLTGQPGLLSMPQIDPVSGRVRELWREPIPPAPDKACLVQRVWGWNGQSFELGEERRSLSCAGSITGHWPKTFAREWIVPAASDAPANAASFQPPC